MQAFHCTSDVDHEVVNRKQVMRVSQYSLRRNVSVPISKTDSADRATERTQKGKLRLCSRSGSHKI